MDGSTGETQAVIAQAALDAKKNAGAKNSGAAVSPENASAVSAASGSRDGKEDGAKPIYAKASYSIKGATKATGLGRNAIYSAINSGALRAKKHGQRTLIIDSDLRAWLASLPNYVPAMQAPEHAMA